LVGSGGHKAAPQNNKKKLAGLVYAMLAENCSSLFRMTLKAILISGPNIKSKFHFAILLLLTLFPNRLTNFDALTGIIWT
jgi:hypothetical protein